MMRASLCMIVYNEEDLLAGAIESAQGLADEVVVVDTGSTDGTAALAAKLGARLVTGGDRMHLGQSRNLGLEQATGDWIVILDADERIVEPGAVRAHLEQTAAESLMVRSVTLDGRGQPVMSYDTMRIWRRGSHEYRYRAHEIPVALTEPAGAVQETDFVWEHRPPMARMPEKRKLNLARLLRDLDENANDPRPLFFLGWLYLDLQQYDEAARRLELCLELAPNGPYAARAWRALGRCRTMQDDSAGQLLALVRAIALDPECGELWAEMGQVLRWRGRYDAAEVVEDVARRLPIPTRGLVNHQWYGRGQVA